MDLVRLRGAVEGKDGEGQARKESEQRFGKCLSNSLENPLPLSRKKGQVERKVWRVASGSAWLVGSRKVVPEQKVKRGTRPGPCCSKWSSILAATSWEALEYFGGQVRCQGEAGLPSCPLAGSTVHLQRFPH